MTKSVLLGFITIITLSFLLSGFWIHLGTNEYPKRLDMLLVLIGSVLGLFGSGVAVFYQKN